MGKRYKARTIRSEKPINYDGIRVIAENCNTYPVLIHALLTRGFTPEEIEKLYNSSDEDLIEYAMRPLRNAELAADKIIEHLRNGSSIYIFADYDCDGITSGYVMYQGIKDARDKLESKSAVSIHYPQRKEGYGLNIPFCDKIIASKSKRDKLVITVDNGITCKEEIRKLNAAGIDTIVTDHHEPNIKKLPDCIIVNPCYNDIKRKYLSGVAVAWNVVSIFLQQLGLQSRKYVPVVTLGTISDVMPMCFENAALILVGLKMINSDDCQKLLSIMHHQDNNKLDYNAVDIAFNIAPKINSASRMGDTRIGAAGFIMEDKAEKAFNALNKMNDERKKVTQKAQRAIKKIELDEGQRFICFDGTEYGPGIMGIIAGEITKNYPDYPAFVYTVKNSVCTGSVRNNNEQLNLLEMFEHQRRIGNLLSYAGHSNACVISIEEDKLDQFIQSFSEDFDSLELSSVTEYYDAKCSLASLNNSFLYEMNKIPFMPQDVPVFYIDSLSVISTQTSMSNKNNIKFHLADNTSSKWVWAWGFTKKYEELGSPKKIGIICSPCQNFMVKNRPDATLKIIDIIPES